MLGLFKQMARDMKAGWDGRINVYPNGFKFSADGCANAQGVHFKAKPDASGRMISLSLNVRTANGCPQPPPGDWPQNNFGRYWVPLKECRKCPHHIKRRRGQPYPCCDVLRQLARAGPTPAEKFASVFEKAAEKVKEIVG